MASKLQGLFVRRPFRPESILVVKLDEIGDMVYALHVFELLRKEHPNALLNVYIKPFNRTLIELTGCADRIIHDPKELDSQYDLLVNLRGDWHTFWLGFRCKMRLERGCVRLANKLTGGQRHETETNYRIILPVLTNSGEMPMPKLVIPDEEKAGVDQLLSESNTGPFALLHTGARDPARRWPGHHFAEIAGWLYREYGLSAVFGGGKDEYDDVEQIRKLIDTPTHNFAGKTSLPGFGALCARATVFIGNESGPMHIANVMDTPCVALFGPGVIDVFYPYGSNVRVIHHFHPRNHKSQSAENSTIHLITVDEVKEAIRSLLD